ncbi:Hint domain-containing protein [Thalassobius sp. I31.1]|uniref:Hint domain-containing protein n=1 Tax=Thalassobius sp. I31.1 TaxID=2109912 RepID=UPI0013002756|nr:Hint domain-containing protein [Thalassobius sp. I31.1]
METLTLYRLSADPAFSGSVTVTAAFTVDITDDDPDLERNDVSGPQLDLSTVPNISNSTNFSVFEQYTATGPSGPVTFIMVQWSPVPYIFLTDGSLSANDVITGTGTGVGPTVTSGLEYTDLPDFVCFAAGTRIETPRGLRLIEDLKAGDQVVLANGLCCPIRWIGCRKLSRAELKAAPHLRPIRFKAGSMGVGCPARDVWLSPQHRVAVTATGLELISDASVMLASAKSLVNGKDVLQRQGFRPVEYFHILFDQHEILNIDGLMCETFFPGETTMDALSEATRGELYELFPDLEHDLHSYGDTALPVLKPYETSVIMSDVRTASKSDFRQFALH